MRTKQHKQLRVSFWALSHALTNQSIKKLSKTANATKTQDYCSLWVGSNNCNWQGQIPCSPVYVRWAYSQTPQIPLSKHNHMVSQLFATSCATVYLAWLPCTVEERWLPLHSNLINPLQWGQNSLRVKRRFLLGFYQSENCVHRGWLHNWNRVNLNFMMAELA